MSIDYAARAQRGAMLLDEKRPGWDGKIDLDTLNLGRTDICVLGQVYGDYSRGAVALGLDAEPECDCCAADADDERCAEYGFVISDEDYYECEEPYPYKSLTAAWRELIKGRRADA